MTNEKHEGQSGPVEHGTHGQAGDMTAARRRGVFALFVEDLEAFTRSRRAAQRGMVHTLESAKATSEIERCHTDFAVEASRQYAAQASRLGALADTIAAFQAAK